MNLDTGQCRPGCENLPRDVSINTNYGRVNGFLVYLYDGPRVPEFDRPGVANVDKIKGKVSVFLGIPYAQPPTGNARLMVRIKEMNSVTSADMVRFMMVFMICLKGH